MTKRRRTRGSPPDDPSHRHPQHLTIAPQRGLSCVPKWRTRRPLKSSDDAAPSAPTGHRVKLGRSGVSQTGSAARTPGAPADPGTGVNASRASTRSTTSAGAGLTPGRTVRGGGWCRWPDPPRYESPTEPGTHSWPRLRRPPGFYPHGSCGDRPTAEMDPTAARKRMRDELRAALMDPGDGSLLAHLAALAVEEEEGWPHEDQDE